MANVVYRQEQLADDLTRVIQASRLAHTARVCLLTTRDRDHALNVLKQVVSAAQQPLYHFTVAGRRRFNTAQFRWDPVGAESPDAAALLRHAIEIRGGGVIVFEDCASFLRDDTGDRRARMIVADALGIETVTDGLVLVFLEPPDAANHLPSMLAEQFVRLDIPYPRAAELTTIAAEELAIAHQRVQGRVQLDRTREVAPQLAEGLVGTTRSAARDSLRDALAPDPSDIAGAVARLHERKSLVLKREVAMDVLDAKNVEEPLGLDFLVEYLKSITAKVRMAGPGRQRGVLLVGPPGTGKTMLATSVGRALHLPVVRFQLASLMSSLLGETEGRFAQAFATLEAMSPNVVFIDELEKAFGDSSERDGGTMMRVTGSLLSWLSDNPYPNFIVATCNSLQRMGEIGKTMTRSERFDACFFVDVPARASRQAMLARWLEGKLPDVPGVSAELAELTEKFSGADLRSLVKEACRQSEYRGRSLDATILREEAERKRARAFALYDEFQELRLWGRSHCDPAGPCD